MVDMITSKRHLELPFNRGGRRELGKPGSQGTDKFH